MKVMFDSVKSPSTFFCGKSQPNNMNQPIKVEPQTVQHGFSNEEIYNGLMSFKNTILRLIPLTKKTNAQTLNQIA